MAENSDSDWYVDCVETYSAIFDVYGEISEEESNRRTLRSIDSLHELFLEVVKARKIKDQWPVSYVAIYPLHRGVIEKSDKMKSEITIGVGESGFYIEVSIDNTFWIQSMNDKFWHHIQQLSEIGNAELINNGHPQNTPHKKEIKNITKFNNSLIYSICRDYVIGRMFDVDYDVIGQISIALPIDTPKEKVYEFFDRGIYNAYRMNYLLYRAASIHMHRLMKSAKAPC